MVWTVDEAANAERSGKVRGVAMKEERWDYFSFYIARQEGLGG